MFHPSRRMFGTDGVRGIANDELTPELAMNLARAAGERMQGGVVIGRDPRRSGDMLAAALQAGFHSIGVDTVDVGVLPTGGIAHLAAATGASLGAVVSASHNPAADNGIKFFGGDGAKLSDEAEDRIEARFRKGAPWTRAEGGRIGMRIEMPEARHRYVEWLSTDVAYSLRGLEVVVDAANGAAFRAAPELFQRLHVGVEEFACEPDGTNINLHCGATSPQELARRVKGRIGLAFDGDADRLVAVDEAGIPLNGDFVMAILARHLKGQDKLRHNLVVTTLMSNLGFLHAMRSLGVEVLQTKVGDRYVLEAMRRAKAVLGGEQSGHVIFADRASTGDGLLTAVRLLEVVAATGLPLTELRALMAEYPQVLRNVRVSQKDRLGEATGLWEAVKDAEASLNGEGRVLVRASGTEPMIRVMVEATSAQRAAELADGLAALARAELEGL